MFVNSKVSWAPMAFDVLAVVAQLSGALLWPLLQVILMVVMVMVVVMRMVVIVMVVVMRMVLVVVVMIRYDAQEDDNDAVNHLYDDEDVLMVVMVMIVMVVVMRIQSDA